MKKIFFAFVLLLVPAILLADDSTQSVVMVSDNGHGHNRNEFVLPVVTYSSDSNTLTVRSRMPVAPPGTPVRSTRAGPPLRIM